MSSARKPSGSGCGVPPKDTTLGLSMQCPSAGAYTPRKGREGQRPQLRKPVWVPFPKGWFSAASARSGRNLKCGCLRCTCPVAREHRHPVSSLVRRVLSPRHTSGGAPGQLGDTAHVLAQVPGLLSSVVLTVAKLGVSLGEWRCHVAWQKTSRLSAIVTACPGTAPFLRLLAFFS